MSKIVNVRIPDTILEALTERAERLGLTRTDCIIHALLMQDEVLKLQKPTKGVRHAVVKGGRCKGVF